MSTKIKSASETILKPAKGVVPPDVAPGTHGRLIANTVENSKLLGAHITGGDNPGVAIVMLRDEVAVPFGIILMSLPGWDMSEHKEAIEAMSFNEDTVIADVLANMNKEGIQQLRFSYHVGRYVISCLFAIGEAADALTSLLEDGLNDEIPIHVERL